ncbi:MAG: polysaccharide biosynthesis/export family protein [Chitinophagaceae bacterium]|jgi:polysaccharide export outer membrane protein|nr:polysaccharide biosynthesis/export family protein [Chitinophagaceae bacterium]
MNQTLFKVNARGTLVLMLAILALASCSPARYNVMTQYLDSTKTINVPQYPFKTGELLIRKNDLVRVRFAGLNKATVEQLNAYTSVAAETTVQSTEGKDITGQLVDPEGLLTFPLIGKVKAEGLSRSQLREKLQELITPFLKDPLVYVDLPKRGVTLFGEVKNPATIVMPKDQPNLFEVLAQVGFTTEFADLERMKVYREFADGSRMVGHLNMNDTSFFSSPFFYPQPDDVIYVPANSEKRVRNVGTTATLFATILIALTTLVINLVR